MQFFAKIFFLILLSSAFVSAVLADELRGFCFKSGTNLKSVEVYLSPILKESDKVHFRSSMNCIEIKLSLARHGLFEKYLRQRFKLIQSYSGDGLTATIPEFSNKKCKIEVLKKGKGKQNRDSFSFSRKGNIRSEQSRDSQVVRSYLLLNEGRSGSIEVDGESVDLTCFSRGGDRFEITLTIKSKRSHNSLSSSITVVVGERVNIGSIVEDLKDRDRTIGLQEGLKYSRKKKQLNYLYFLTVK